MKIQDIFFLILLLFLLWKRDVWLPVLAGLALLLLSIPLFATWTFFTAERFTWYAAGYFLLAVLLYFWDDRKKSP